MRVRERLTNDADVAALRAERDRQRLSLADVATRLGIGRGAIHKIKIDLNRNPTIDTLTRCAEALGVRTGDFRLDLVARNGSVRLAAG